MKLNTVIKSPPISVTAHRGILSKNPQSSTASMISSGKTVSSVLPKPAVCIIVLVTPCMMLNNAIISSSPYVTTPFAIAKRIKIFNACSGLFTSVKLPQVLTTPTTKNKPTRHSRLPAMLHESVQSPARYRHP